MRRVVKVGGSLLLRESLRESLSAWFARQSEAETLVVVGGGQLIDAIRQLEQIHGGDAVEIHWLCVELLQTTCRLCSSWFDWECIRTPESLSLKARSGFKTAAPYLVCVTAFYDRDQLIAGVPQDWRTTSDTIAALLADRMAADELVLLKSCPVEPSTSIQRLAELGIVDEAFPQFASRIPVIRVETLG